MAEIVLIRHGQASLGADDYDRLSDIGFQQGRLLGQYWRERHQSFDRIVMGSMLRHKQTTESFLRGYYERDDECAELTEVAINGGFNEYNHTYLLAELARDYPEFCANTGHLQRDYYHNIRRALKFWAEGKIVTDGQDTWASFAKRIQCALADSMQAPFKRLLVVSSGGPISNMLAHFLDMPAAGMIDTSLRIKNTSMTTIVTNRTEFTVDTINDVSHLADPTFEHLITLA